MRSRSAIQTALLFALQGAFPLAQAAVSCAGTISYLGVGNAGTLTVAVSGQAINTICSMTTQGTFHVDPAACKAAYAMLLSAQARGASVRLYYNDLTDCSQVQAWSGQPSIYWVDLVI